MRIVYIIVLSLFVSAAMSQSKKQVLAENKKLKSEIAELKKIRSVDLEDKHQEASYAMGVLIGYGMSTQGGDSLVYDAILAGLDDVFLYDSIKIDPRQCDQIVQAYITEIRQEQETTMKKEGEEFLASNKTKAGVKTTDSGLQYVVVKSGTGKSPADTSRVTVHYTGKLIDGTVFDSSVERGEPATFPLNRVIPGWTEGLQLMKEGGKWTFFIPYDLGYGASGAGSDIPPYSTLIFEVELLKVEE